MPILDNSRHDDLSRVRKMVRYNPDTGELKWLVDYYRVKAGDDAGQSHPGGYRMVTIDRHRMLVHRLAWALHYGEWPDRNIDHINGDRSDNRIGNLRLATQAENSRNSCLRTTNTSGYKGVSRVGARWRSSITLNGVQRHLGRFDSPVAAYEAYCKAASLLHGEFARLV